MAEILIGLRRRRCLENGSAAVLPRFDWVIATATEVLRGNPPPARAAVSYSTPGFHRAGKGEAFRALDVRRPGASGFAGFV